MTNIAEYGFKKDGTPKQKPGRKAGGGTRQRTIYLIDGVPAGVGRPTPEILRKRTKVEIPFGATYDVELHGPGVHDPADDIEADRILAERAQREADKAAQKAAEAARLAAKVVVVPPGTPQQAPEPVAAL